MISFFPTAIFNEQQAGNCNVAVTSLHCLLLNNVYSSYFRVSICNKGNSSFKIDINMQALIVVSSTSDYVSVYLLLFVFCRPYAAANFYQRALLANALTSALRLHQRLPRFQLSRTFLAQALQEDSCHYLLYSLILVNSYPITSILLLSKEGEMRDNTWCLSV